MTVPKNSGSPKIKVYADKLEKEMMMRRWAMFGNIAVYIFLIGVIVYLSFRGNVIVVGENLVASGVSGFSYSDPEIVRIRADGHARLFYERFFTFDYNNFAQQKNKAIYLGGEAVETVYVLLKKAGFYEEVINNHYLVRSTLDSSKVVSGSGGKVGVHCYGKMSLTNNVYLENRRLDLKLLLSPVAPIKELNPFGFSIDKMDLLSNEVLQAGTITGS